MKAELINYMGSDLTVVNAARVSFDKESGWEPEFYIPDEFTLPGEPKALLPVGKVLGEKDQRLLSYLAKHNHWTPFSHVQITMRETVPIFVARQRFKHVVGFTYNETSRRYVDSPPEFFVPDQWRKAADNKKQGSSDETINLNNYYFFPDADGDSWNDRTVAEEFNQCMERVVFMYNWMIELGVAPEQARMVLPQSMYTSYYVTGSLAAWARAYKLRIDPHAQREIQDLAVQWNDIITNIPELKHSWNALTQG